MAAHGVVEPRSSTSRPEFGNNFERYGGKRNSTTHSFHPPDPRYKRDLELGLPHPQVSYPSWSTNSPFGDFYSYSKSNVSQRFLVLHAWLLRTRQAETLDFVQQLEKSDEIDYGFHVSDARSAQPGEVVGVTQSRQLLLDEIEGKLIKYSKSIDAK